MTGRPLRIVLVGLMGAGKTTVGRALAAHLGWAFLDLDDLTGQAAGRSVADIFAREGEAGFRRREEGALASALALERVVIATGGGVVLSSANRERLAAEPWVIWLEAPPEELARRLAGPGAASRPLLAAVGSGSASPAGEEAPGGAEGRSHRRDDAEPAVEDAPERAAPNRATPERAAFDRTRPEGTTFDRTGPEQNAAPARLASNRAAPEGAAPDQAALARRLAQLLEQRAGAYAAVARHRIPTAGRPVDRVVADILERLEGRRPNPPRRASPVSPGSPVRPASSRSAVPDLPPAAAAVPCVPSPTPGPASATRPPVPDPDLVIEAGPDRYPLWVRPGAVTGTPDGVGLELLLATVAVPGPGAASAAGGRDDAGSSHRPGAGSGSAGRAPVALLVSDPVVSALYGRGVAAGLERVGFRVTRAVVPAGEEAKSLEWAARLYDRLVEAEAGRDAWVFALGGGVVGDLAGFVAATYMRGIAFAQLPTTLLAQVDASAGGKVAVNHPRAKNLIGAFHQPRLVVADPATLATQPQAAYRGGLAEMVKHALLDGNAHLAALEDAVPLLLDRDPAGLAPLIARSVAVKARIVAQDPEERGPRAFLNLGHTFAHALEAATGYRVPHGDAVAAGLALALALSERLGMAPAGLGARVQELLTRLGLPVTLAQACREWDVDPPAPQDLLGRLQHDKKNRQGRVRFVLLGAPGHVALRDDVPPDLVEELVRRSLAGRLPG